MITIKEVGIIIAMLLFVGNSYCDLKVYPRIFTPGSPPENENVIFDFDYSDEPKPKLTIFDIDGRKIKEISTLNPNAMAIGCWRLFWDGRDDNGCLVLPGVYIYQWEENRKIISGTVVVAR